MVEGKSINASRIFILIFKLSSINSVRKVLFAKIPPTFAAALIIKSGFTSFIVLLVSSSEKRFVSCLLDPIISVTVFEFDKFLTRFDPTKPLDPKTRILIFSPFLIPLYTK